MATFFLRPLLRTFGDFFLKSPKKLKCTYTPYKSSHTMSYLIQSARKLVSVFTEQPTPLEIQMAKQLKEQSLQMEEMKQLMEGMKTLIAKMEPIVDAENKRIRLFSTRIAENKERRRAENEERRIAARKAEERKAEERKEEERKAEEARKVETIRKAEELRLLIAARKAEKKSAPWSCPTDGMVYPWTYKGVKYLRNSDNQLWMYDGKDCGDWKGLYLIAEDRIDESAIDPYEDE